MNESKRRVSWITRVNVRPAERDELREIAKEQRVTIASLIGLAVSDFLTAGSST